MLILLIVFLSYLGSIEVSIRRMKRFLFSNLLELTSGEDKENVQVSSYSRVSKGLISPLLVTLTVLEERSLGLQEVFNNITSLSPHLYSKGLVRRTSPGLDPSSLPVIFANNIFTGLILNLVWKNNFLLSCLVHS